MFDTLYMAGKCGKTKLLFALQSDYTNLNHSIHVVEYNYFHILGLFCSQCLTAPSIEICVDLFNHTTTRLTGLLILEEPHLLVQGQARMSLEMVKIFKECIKTLTTFPPILGLV